MAGRVRSAGDGQRRRRGAAVLSVVVIALGLVGISPVPVAAAVGSSTFDATDGVRDDGVATVDDEASGPKDNSFSGSGPKEDDLCPSMDEDHSAPRNADIASFSYGTQASDPEVLYLAWERYENNGTLTFDFELNQLDNVSYSCPAPGAPTRTVGDLLFTYDFQGGTAVDPAIVIEVRKWTGAAWGAPISLAAGSHEQSISTDLLFGEMAIDLVGSGILSAAACNDFGAAWAKTRTGSTSAFETSTIKDYVTPVATSISNCGSIIVTKTVTGASGTNDQASFEFSVSCTNEDLNGAAAGTALAFDLGHGGSREIEDIHFGEDCTVAETSPAPASHWSTSFRVDGGGSTTGLTTPPLETTATPKTVAFTNTRRTGGLTIDKTTTGGSGTFTFDVDCSVDGFDQQVRITDTDDVTISGIPVGTTCTVTEVADPRFDSTPAGGITRVVDADGETAAFTNVRKVGSLTIDKTTDGGSGTFSFDVDCSDDRFDRTVQLTDDENVTIEDIPTGTTCTVTEDADPRYTSSVSPTDGAATIEENGETIRFLNVRKVAGLTIAKTTSGGTGTFTFHVDCDGTAHDAQVQITGTGSVTIDDIPTDTDCTVTEVADPLFTSSSDPSGGRVTIDDDGETVSFTNVRNTGSLVVAKTATGGDGNFTFDVDCTDDAFDQAVVVTTTDGAGSSGTITGIPTMTSCTVTETVPAGWAAVGGATRTVVIDGAETAAFTNRLLPSGIQVVKTASAETVQAGTPVTYTYVVTNLGETPLTSVVVMDDKCADVTRDGGDDDGDGVLDLTEVWTYSCTSPLTVTTTNVGTATGLDPRNRTVQDTDSRTVTVIGTARGTEPLGAVVVADDTVTNAVVAPLELVQTAPVSLPRTGLGIGNWLQIGSALVLLGLALLVPGRRLRSPES